MIIYPLLPDELDDLTLEAQIKQIAQTLCNVHQNLESGIKNRITYDNSFQDIELIHKCKYTQWASECRANYLRLVEMGEKEIEEYHKRFNGEPKRLNKYSEAIIWARDNVPIFCDTCKDIGEYNRKWHEDTVKCVFCKSAETPFPLCVPEEYIIYVEAPDGVKMQCFGEELTVKQNIIESYRNYYRANLQPKAICMNCKIQLQPLVKGVHFNKYNCDKCSGSSCLEKTEPTWTRREKPNWL